MSNTLLDYTRNSIWSGFLALTDYNSGLLAPKSRLKVFVASLGTIFDLSGAENGLDDFRSSSFLNFSQFEFYLSREVFSGLSDALTRSEISSLEKRVDEICWTIAKSKLGNLGIEKESAFKLFRIFCLLADLVRDENGNAQALISPEEADLVFNKLISAVSKNEDTKEDFECLFSNALFDLQTFLSVVEIKFIKAFGRTEVSEAIQDIYDEYVDEIIKKGSLLRRGAYLPKYTEQLFILRPFGLTYYSNPKKQKILKFDSQTRIEEGKPNSKSKLFTINLITTERVLTLATLDRKYGNQWLSSIKLALSRIYCQESYGRYQRDKRRLEWHRLKIRQEIEMDRRNEMLLAEKLARHAAEDYARELSKQKAVEEKRRLELDITRRTLEKLLAEEIQAKKDEEIVRMLQARILNEEWEKRDQLEKLQEEQKMLLEVEINKNRNYQKKTIELERLLQEAGQKLRDLETSRLEMDFELRAARAKNAERNREILETRLKLFSAPIVEVENQKIHRTRRSVSMREGKNHLRPIIQPKF